MERIVKTYSNKSKRKMVMGIKKIKKAHTEREKRLENELYARVKAGEACPMCGKDYDVSNPDHCTCDTASDEVRDNRMSEGE